MTVRRIITVLALSSLFLTGCQGLCRRDPPRSYPPLPSGGTGNIPPTNIPDGPPLPPRGSGSGYGAELLLPQPLPPGKTRSEYPYDSVPANPIPKAQPYAPRAKVLESQPQPTPMKPETVEPAPLEESRPKPLEANRPQPKPAPETATGIEEFTMVREGVTAGLRPSLEGLDWLQTKSYKTVIYLRRTDDDDRTDRRQVEKHGMKYISIVVKPEELTQTFIDEFSAHVGELENRPVFVYARDGGVSSAVWYMHLRRAEFLTHDEARVRIARLGFKDENNDYFKAALKFFEKP